MFVQSIVCVLIKANKTFTSYVTVIKTNPCYYSEHLNTKVLILESRNYSGHEPIQKPVYGLFSNGNYNRPFYNYTFFYLIINGVD
jgi:hypothetical protein